MDKRCDNCKRSYDIGRENEVRCVYYDKYPAPSECCEDWEERSGDLVNRDMAMQAVTDAKSVLLAFAAVKHLPSVDAVPRKTVNEIIGAFDDRCRELKKEIEATKKAGE